MRYIVVGMAFLVMLKMFDGFFGINKLKLLQYHFFWKIFYVGSPTLVWVSSSFSNEESFSQLCLPSMNGDALSDSLLMQSRLLRFFLLVRVVPQRHL
ncbi:unnamed protein product [Brassica rapa subsp. trilocularis]